MCFQQVPLPPRPPSPTGRPSTTEVGVISRISSVSSTRTVPTSTGLSFGSSPSVSHCLVSVPVRVVLSAKTPRSLHGALRLQVLTGISTGRCRTSGLVSTPTLQGSRHQCSTLNRPFRPGKNSIDKDSYFTLCIRVVDYIQIYYIIIHGW